MWNPAEGPQSQGQYHIQEVCYEIASLFEQEEVHDTDLKGFFEDPVGGPPYIQDTISHIGLRELFDEGDLNNEEEDLFDDVLEDPTGGPPDVQDPIGGPPDIQDTTHIGQRELFDESNLNNEETNLSDDAVEDPVGGPPDN